MTTDGLLDESTFHQCVDALLLALEEMLEEAADSADDAFECDATSGILTLSFANGSKIIINRQTPLRELWVAAKSGGYHFRPTAEGWIDSRSGETLEALLTRAITEQSGHVMNVGWLPKPDLIVGTNI